MALALGNNKRIMNVGQCNAYYDSVSRIIALCQDGVHGYNSDVPQSPKALCWGSTGGKDGITDVWGMPLQHHELQWHRRECWLPLECKSWSEEGFHRNSSIDARLHHVIQYTQGGEGYQVQVGQSSESRHADNPSSRAQHLWQRQMQNDKSSTYLLYSTVLLESGVGEFWAQISYGR